jgi:hypothetical protein
VCGYDGLRAVSTCAGPMAQPEGGSIYDWAVRIQVDWNRLTRLAR